MEYTRRKKAVIVVVIALVVFGASQYVAATGIAISITSSEFVGTSSDGAMYELKVAVSNPTLFPITVGDTEFTVSEEGRIIGNGVVKSFVMPVMGEIVVDGTYLVNPGESQNSPTVKISGTTSYNLLIGSISIPFEYDV